MPAMAAAGGSVAPHHFFSSQPEEEMLPADKSFFPTFPVFPGFAKVQTGRNRWCGAGTKMGGHRERLFLQLPDSDHVHFWEQSKGLQAYWQGRPMAHSWEASPAAWHPALRQRGDWRRKPLSGSPVSLPGLRASTPTPEGLMLVSLYFCS